MISFVGAAGYVDSFPVVAGIDCSTITTCGGGGLRGSTTQPANKNDNNKTISLFF
jgi:hypothetical protein